jgi:Lrp/AsnC family leucine-responsive transcriptional regulator
MALDAIDLAILEVLQQDGRATSAELAERVGLSASPCHRRQRLLEDAGVIQRYVALLDQAKVGLAVHVFVTIELTTQSEANLERFERVVADCPEVMECYEMAGTSDYLLRVVCADLASYEQFMRSRLSRIEGVRAIRSAFALKRVIYRTGLPLRRPAK